MKSIPEQIKEIRGKVNGYKLSQVIMTAEELGIFRSIGQGNTELHEIAADLGVPSDELSLLLNVLASSRLLQKNGLQYTVAEDFSTLNPNHPASQNGYIRYAKEVRDRWLELSTAVRNNQVAEKNFREITGVDEDATEAFMAAMHANAQSQAVYISQNYNFDDHHILDVGAGTGIYSIKVVEDHVGSSATLFELPEVVPVTMKYVEASSVSERLDVMPGDYHRQLPEGVFDDIFLFAVIHQEAKEKALALLQKLYSNLKPGGRLFLTSFFLDDDRIGPPFSVMFAVEMLVMVPNGKAYTHKKVKELLEQAAFSNVDRVDAIPGPATLYVATR
jgi:SAM-dependent methyltransferase